MILSELLHPTPNGSLDGKIVQAVSALPLDDPPTREGNDAIHKPGAETLKSAVDRSASKPSTRMVPFVRTLRRGDTGKDVIAVQRALQAAGIRKRRPTGWYGPVMVANVKAFQKAHKIHVTGVYDPLTHHALVGYFDAYGAYLMQQAWTATKVAGIRKHIVAAALFGYVHRAGIDYSQGSHRLDAVRDHVMPPHFPSATDCSGFATWTYEVGGGPDPSGFKFNVRKPHFTGAMAVVGHKVESPSLADLILYGHGPDFDHVTIYVGNGRCISMGSNPGPLLLPIHYRDDLAMFRSYL